LEGPPGVNWSSATTRIRALGAWSRKSLTARAIRSIAEFIGKLTVVVGLLSFVIEAPDRAKQRHYQAWQLINGARGAPGDAGRRTAIADLIKDHVTMYELDLTGGNFEEMDFRSAIVPGLDLSKAKLNGADFSCRSGLFVTDYWWPTYSRCWKTNLEGARIQTETYHVNFSNANLRGAVLGGEQSKTRGPNEREIIPFFGNILTDANFERGVIGSAWLIDNAFVHADMRHSVWITATIGSHNSFVGTDLSDSIWQDVEFLVRNFEEPSDFTDANLSGVRMAELSPAPLKTPTNFRALSEDDMPASVAILCRTKFSDHVSNRDCHGRE
jgi:uncharacterized protein YjbI with pentapeptide repeats